MREFVKSMIGFSWALSLFGARRVGDVLASADDCEASHRAAGPLESVGHATTLQLNPTMKGLFDSGDKLQRMMVDALFDVLPSSEPGVGARARAPVRPQDGGRSSAIGVEAHSARRPDSGRLDTTTFVVLGEGMAAGMCDFMLSADTQRGSFPALVAAKMGTPFVQPLVQADGIGPPPGFEELPVIMHAPMQTSVLEQWPPPPASNLSVPGVTVHDALNLRPVAPLVHRRNAKQTAVNLFWGVLPLAQGDQGPLPTQLEYAVRRAPTFAIISLGYAEVVEAAVRGDRNLLPDPGSFRSDYRQLVAGLRDSGAEVLVMTVPDPMDTACVCSLAVASKLLKVNPDFLGETYDLGGSDLLTVHGLNEIGFQLFARAVEPLPPGAVLSEGTAQSVSDNVGQLNAAIDSAAREYGALEFDLHALFASVRCDGVKVGPRRLTGEYLDGFYGLNGAYPGATGQAVIANELLRLLDGTYSARLGQVDLEAVLRADPVAGYRQAAGARWDASHLAGLPRVATSPREVAAAAAVEKVASRAGGDAARARSIEEVAALPRVHQTSPPRLQLPPGLEQVLPLSKAASYFGDGIAAQNCRDEQLAKWGACGGLLFGGLAMVDSHLAGHIRIKFAPPVGDLTRFDISFCEGLVGDDAVLVAPQYFKMGFQQSRVDDVPGMVSSGNLNLATGEATDLKIYARYASTALMALVAVNPTFPKQPLSFPGPYGSAWARFEQRPDGTLDFAFYGSAFVPLGPGTKWPLNFVGPSRQFATIPASGTVMHPHLHLSTKDPVGPDASDDPPDVPFNTIQELTLHTHNSSFGDAFTLAAPELGGPAKGRSHILGRVQLQFGARCGDSVPVAVAHLDAGGVFNEMPPSPITAVFPGRLYPGPRGFNEFLRFPLRTYSLDDLAILDDPFDISMGMVDLKTGRFVSDLLHRAFINQDLIFALLRVETRTPKDSFFFRGPARLQRGSHGEMVFRHQAAVRVPYPEGFLFPKPNLTTGIPIGPHSVLDPFLWVRAIEDERAGLARKEGRGDQILSSGGELFSYRYRVSGDGGDTAALFEYENHTQKGLFRMHRLSWMGFGNSLESDALHDEYDTVTFSGFGTWVKDGVESLQQAAVQISTSLKSPYVGIQIGSGDVSDVNTKPEIETDALP